LTNIGVEILKRQWNLHIAFQFHSPCKRKKFRKTKISEKTKTYKKYIAFL